MGGWKTAKWLLIIFGLLAAGVVLAGAGLMVWLYRAISGVGVR